MLVVRRRIGEAIVVGEGVEIAVIEISPTRVKLGITAPREVTVVRKEIAGIAEDNRRAALLMDNAAQSGLNDIFRMLTGAHNSPPQTDKTTDRTADKNRESESRGIAENGLNPRQT
jgi:carbon storage regulator